MSGRLITTWEEAYKIWWQEYGRHSHKRHTDKSMAALKVIKTKFGVSTAETDLKKPATEGTVEDPEQSDVPRIRDWARNTHGLFGSHRSHLQAQSFYPGLISNERILQSKPPTMQSEDNTKSKCQAVRAPPRVLHRHTVCDGCVISPHGSILHTTKDGQVVGGYLLELEHARKAAADAKADLDFERELHALELSTLQARVATLETELQSLIIQTSIPDLSVLVASQPLGDHANSTVSKEQAIENPTAIGTSRQRSKSTSSIKTVIDLRESLER